MNRQRIPIRLGLLLLAFSLAVPVTHASIVPPGATLPPDPLAAPIGALLNSTSGTIVTPTFTTSYTEWVYSATNGLCPGCLDFVYQFTDSGATGINERYTASSFANFAIDVGWVVTSPGPPPVSVDRSVNGSVVGFNYTGAFAINPGQSTPLLIIETNATHYGSGFLSAQDGTAGSAVGFAPATTTPEPATLPLLASGIFVAGGFLRRWLR